MWWNAIGLISMIMVPGAFAAVALAAALRQADRGAHPIGPTKRPIRPWVRGR